MAVRFLLLLMMMVIVVVVDGHQVLMIVAHDQRMIAGAIADRICGAHQFRLIAIASRITEIIMAIIMILNRVLALITGVIIGAADADDGSCRAAPIIIISSIIINMIKLN